MKKQSFALSLSALIAVSTCSAVTYYPNPSTSSINGVRGLDYWMYDNDGSGLLVRVDGQPAISPIDMLQGNSASPTGNLELFANTFDPKFNDMSASGAFATTTPIMVSGVMGPQAYSLRSLNGNDWFMDSAGTYNLSYGANNLANTWWNGLVTEMLSHSNSSQQAFLNTNEPLLFNFWRDSEGFLEMSDANISYAYWGDTSGFTVGLAGFYNGTDEMRNRMRSVVYEYFRVRGHGRAHADGFLAQIPEGIQMSEVVMLNGAPIYNFEATPSGLTMVDNSYTGNFEITQTVVPEPTSMLSLLSGILVLGFWRKK